MEGGVGGPVKRIVSGLAAALALAAGPAPSALARVILVGLDGASWNVIDPMVAAGELPNLAAIAREGVTAELETVEPVTSPVVWTSIATGRSPEHHGVTDFFTTAARIRTPTIFERLAAQGHRVGLYDYLMTWPPIALPDGFVIPGWLRRDDSLHPPDLWQLIGFDPWVNAYGPLKTSEDYRRNALEEARVKAPRWNAMVEHFDLEVGAVSFFGPDGMSHRFWHGAFPSDFSPKIPAGADQRTALRDVMRGVDLAIGEIRAALDEDDTILVVSDHGFRAHDAPKDVWVSRFDALLAREGLDPERDGFTILTEFGRLVVQVHPAGFESAEATTARIAQLIESARTPDGDDLYWAAEVLDIAPRPPGHERAWWQRLRQWAIVKVLEIAFDVELDPASHAVVLAVPRAGVLEEQWPDGRVTAAGRETSLDAVFSRQVFTGDHDPIAVFLAAGGALAHRSERDRISVLDVGPLLLYLAGSAVPEDLEGRVPVRFLEPAALATRPVQIVPADALPGISRLVDANDPSEDPELIERLRRLGYIE